MSVDALPRQRSGGFSPVVMIAIILVGIFSFSAFLTLSAFAPELTSGRDGRAHALSQSAVGFAGIVQLERARGVEVVVGRTQFDVTRDEALVVITPEHDLSYEDIGPAAGRVTLIVLPKWGVAAHPTHRGWATLVGPLDPRLTTQILSELSEGVSVAQQDGETRPVLMDSKNPIVTAGPIQGLQTISGPNVVPVITDAQGRIILGRLGAEGSYYVLADPDFLNTQGIDDLSTARAGVAILDMLRATDEPIVFDVTLNGLGSSRSALRLAFEPPFLGATLGLVITAALLGWRAASRSGPSAPRRRAIAIGKAALADNSAALIRLAHREAKLGPGYAKLIGASVAENVGGGRREYKDDAAWLDRVAAANGVEEKFTELEAEAASAKKPSQMLEAARKLFAWKERMKRATR
jgi:hypothetical protein